MASLVMLGKIVKPHGFRGHFVVKTDTGRDSALSYLREIQVGSNRQQTRTLHIVESSWMPKGWKIHVKEVDSEQGAESLRGETLFAKREDLAPLPKDEFYAEDLVGSQVIDSLSHLQLGTISGIEFKVGTTGHDRWWVSTPNGPISIPAHRRYLEKVEPAERKIWVSHWEELK